MLKHFQLFFRIYYFKLDKESYKYLNAKVYALWILIKITVLQKEISKNYELLNL